MSQSSDFSSFDSSLTPPEEFSSSTSSKFSDCQSIDSYDTSSSEDKICRYCLEECQDNNNLIKPCECQTMVHKKCLLKWLEHKSRTRCEICLAEYRIQYKTECRLRLGLLKNKIFQMVFLQLLFWAIGSQSDFIKYHVAGNEIYCFDVVNISILNLLYRNINELIFINFFALPLFFLSLNALFWYLFFLYVYLVFDYNILDQLPRLNNRWIFLVAIVIYIFNGLIYLLGNVLLPMTIPDFKSDLIYRYGVNVSCSMYDQSERIDYQLNHRPIFNWLTWYLGLYSILTISYGLAIFGLILLAFTRCFCKVRRTVIIEA